MMVCTFCSDAECAHHFFFTGACMSLTPTDEQSAIIHWQGQKLVVNAFAGTGRQSGDVCTGAQPALQGGTGG